MAVEFLQRDFCEIYCRLFDHRPAIKSEIGFFVREFEEKRKNQEEVKLQKALEYGREINENLISSCVQLLHNSVPELNDSVNGVIQHCHKILEDEKDISKADWLAQKRLERQKNWAAYLDGMCEKTAAVDRQFEEEVKRVEEYYNELRDLSTVSGFTAS